MDVDVPEHDRRTRAAHPVKEEGELPAEGSGDGDADEKENVDAQPDDAHDTADGDAAADGHDESGEAEDESHDSGDSKPRLDEEEEGPTEGGDEGVTRCVCGNPGAFATNQTRMSG